MTTVSADVVVVGGGVIGASIAYHLAVRGAQVRLVERGGLCSGETAKSGGFVQTHWDLLAEVKLIARSREVFAEFAERVGGDCGYTRGGYLHVTGMQRLPSVVRVHQMLLAAGIESIWLDPKECQELQPLLFVDDLVGGAYEPASGWANPRATTLALAEAARRHGAWIDEGVEVTAIEVVGGRVTGVATRSGDRIACAAVVLAVGPWTNRLALAPLPIEVERGQVCYLDRPGGLPERAVGFYDEVTGLYTHVDGDTNLVGIDWPFEHVDADAYDTQIDPRYVEGARQRLAHRFPALASAQLVRGVVGLYDFSPDGQPILDGPLGGIAGYYVAAGFSGVGFKSAPATGLGMAELVLDGRATSVDIAHMRLDRFARRS